MSFKIDSETFFASAGAKSRLQLRDAQPEQFVDPHAQGMLFLRGEPNFGFARAFTFHGINLPSGDTKLELFLRNVLKEEAECDKYMDLLEQTDSADPRYERYAEVVTQLDDLLMQKKEELERNYYVDSNEHVFKRVSKGLLNRLSFSAEGVGEGLNKLTTLSGQMMSLIAQGNYYKGMLFG